MGVTILTGRPKACLTGQEGRRHPCRILLLTFTPAAGESLTPGEPLPDRTFTKSGIFTWSQNGRTRTFVVTTVAPLEWDASCATDRKIVAGEIHATLGDGSYISTTWTGCGEDPTRAFAPVS